MGNCLLRFASRWADSQYLKINPSDEVLQIVFRIVLSDASTLFETEAVLARNMAKNRKYLKYL